MNARKVAQDFGQAPAHEVFRGPNRRPPAQFGDGEICLSALIGFENVPGRDGHRLAVGGHVTGVADEQPPPRRLFG